MRRVQAAALRLFSRRGFDAVTIEEIAAVAGVGPATIYRNFGSKERVILWDEYDPLLFRCIEQQLACSPPLYAMRDGFIESLGRIYRQDAARILRRARLIRTTPTLLAAAAADMAALRRALAELLAPTVHNAFRRAVLAAAVVGTLTAALDCWIDEKGRRPLAALIKQGFAELGSLAA